MFIGIPNSPTNPVSLARIRYFSEQESRILVERVLRDDPNKAIKHRTIAWRDVKAVVSIHLSFFETCIFTYISCYSSPTGDCCHILS